MPKLRRSDIIEAMIPTMPASCIAVPSALNPMVSVGRMANGRHVPANANIHVAGDPLIAVASRRATYIVTINRLTMRRPSQLNDPLCANFWKQE